MYVNPFLFGVFSTLFVEVVLLLIIAIYSGGKR